MTRAARSNTKNKHEGLNSPASLLGPFPEQNLNGEVQRKARDCSATGLSFNFRWLKLALCCNLKDHGVEILNKPV